MYTYNILILFPEMVKLVSVMKGMQLLIIVVGKYNYYLQRHMNEFLLGARHV